MTTTEFAAPVPPPSIIPPRLERVPYCDPEAPNSEAFGVLADYDPARIAEDGRLLNYFSEAYEDHKAGMSEHDDPADHIEAQNEGVEPKNEGPTLDLRLPDHLDGMIVHTLAHAVTGLVDAGLSNTSCIPYWDRQAMRKGLEYQDPGNAAARLELIDILGINALRTWCQFLPDQALDHRNRLTLIGQAMLKGRRSKEDMSNHQAERLLHNNTDFRLYSDLFTAKLKHLLWLVDQQPDQQIRWHMMDELSGYVKQAVHVLGVDQDNLTVDMGVDTGMSEHSSRPLYDISMFVQLEHLHEPGQAEQTFAVDQGRCHRLSVLQLLNNIERSGSDLPFYEEDGRYRLPWVFDGQSHA